MSLPPSLRRVLLIDDNKSFTDLVACWLEGRYELEVRNDSPGALQVISARPPDVLLLDLMMPEVSGLDILLGVRARPELASLPVVVLTAYALAAESEGIRELGPRAFLQKPFASQTLLDCLDAILADLPPPGAEDGRGELELVRELIDELQGQGLELVEAVDERYPRPPLVHGSRPDVVAYDRERSLLHLGIVETASSLRAPGARLRIRELSRQVMGEGASEGATLPLTILVPPGESAAARRLVDDMGLGDRVLRDLFIVET